MAFNARGADGRAHTHTALSDINITPLVDVVLVLLLIFMLTAPVLQSGIDVALPHTRSTQTLTEERTVITIDKDGDVFLQSHGADEPVNLADIPARLKPDAGRIVYVRADERVPFGAFASVMEAIKQSGTTNISVVTQPYER